MSTPTAALPPSAAATLRSSPPATAQLPRQASLMRSLCVVAAAGTSDGFRLRKKEQEKQRS